MSWLAQHAVADASIATVPLLVTSGACPASRMMSCSCYVQVRELCSIKPQELHLLPFYARIAASMSPIFPTVGDTISQAAESQFNLLRVSPACSAP